MHFDSWLVSLREILLEQKKTLMLQNGHWEIIDREAQWDSLGPRIFDSQLDQFQCCAVEVLTEIDPQFELPADERYAASIHGKVLKHSSDLRQGIAETLALLGSHGDKLTSCSKHKPESVVILTMRAIFEEADWKLWGSLTDLLPTLAEAAPDEFLNSVEKALRQTPCPFVELFAQEGKGITGRNYITGLLWALEGLAWSEEYLIRVVLILADLASRDPGGNWANRPANSLITILLPWHPQTLASIEKRITAIKAIKADFPDVTWKLILGLLPNQFQSSFGSHKPRWRNIVSEDWEPRVPDTDYWDQVVSYAALAVEIGCKDLGKLKELIDNLDNLPKPSFDAVLAFLSSEAIARLSESERLPIWTKLTEFAMKHRRFSDAKWALKEESVSKIEKTANKLAPTSPEGLYRWLFNNRDIDLYENYESWEEQGKKLGEKRQHAIREILSARGLKGVMAFVDAVELPDQVGWILGIVAETQVDFYLLPKYLDNEQVAYQKVVASFVWSRYHHQGAQWADGLDRNNWSLMQCCQLLLYLPFQQATWRRVREWLGDSENMYWQKVAVNPYQSDSDPLYVIDKLLEVARPQAAIFCLYYRLLNKMPLDSKRTIRALLDAVSVKESVGTMDSYQTRELIKGLQNDPQTDQDDLFKVEWAYLPLLDRHSNAKPKLLETMLATKPDFFCEVIRLIYRSKKEEKQEEEPDEKKKAIATNAWRLLYGWKRPPGLRDDGSFSSEDFYTWLEKVKKECIESGHLKVAMLKAGEVLFYCPSDPSGLWIVKAAAEALNAQDADEMRRGFRTGVINSRGVHTVDPTGKPERMLASEWREKADIVEKEGFARFATILRTVAQSYDRQAERIIEEHKAEEKLE